MSGESAKPFFPKRPLHTTVRGRQANWHKTNEFKGSIGTRKKRDPKKRTVQKGDTLYLSGRISPQLLPSGYELGADYFTAGGSGSDPWESGRDRTEVMGAAGAVPLDREGNTRLRLSGSKLRQKKSGRTPHGSWTNRPKTGYNVGVGVTGLPIGDWGSLDIGGHRRSGIAGVRKQDTGGTARLTIPFNRGGKVTRKKKKNKKKK